MIEPVLSWIIPSGVLVTLIIFVVKNNTDNDRRINRVYERLDDVKEDHDIKFTTKEMCNVMHRQIQADIAEIKTDVKMLVKKSNGS